MKRIGVIGSINMDLVTVVDRFPRPGETVTGRKFTTMPGGKGANQAVAASRLGAPVSMIGKVGDDIYGHRYLDILKTEGVDTRAVTIERGVSTGTAIIEVETAGENRIILVPGANHSVNPAFIDSHADTAMTCDAVLLQLEIPLGSVTRAAEMLKKGKRTVILDPAPARPLPDSLLGLVDILTPNETEASVLTGQDTATPDGVKKAAENLLARGASTIVIKAGGNGAYLAGKGEFIHIPGFQVDAIDTTGAGDSFNAGLAVALVRGLPIAQAVRFANAVGALSTTGLGAQGAMPNMAQAEALFK